MESFWEKDRKNYQEFEPIKNNMNTSVCIIGGGLLV